MEPLKLTFTQFALLTIESASLNPPFLRVAISLIFTEASWSPKQSCYLLKEGITAEAQVKTRDEHLLSIELKNEQWPKHEQYDRIWSKDHQMNDRQMLPN